MTKETNDIEGLSFRIGMDYNNNYILTGATSSDGVEYVDVGHSKIIINKAPRTVWRRIEEMKSMNGCKKVSLPHYIEVQGKYFFSRHLFEKKRKKNKKKTMNDSYILWLKSFKWDIAGCVRYKMDISLTTLKRRMKAVNNAIDWQLGTPGVVFYVCEKNPDNPKSYHAHFVAGYENKYQYDKMSAVVKSVLAQDGKRYEAETWIDSYKPEKGYIDYMMNKVDFSYDTDMYDILTQVENNSEYLS